MAVQELDPAYADISPAPDRIGPRRTSRLVTWLDRPVVPAALTVAATLGFTLGRWQRWSKGHIASWILVGSRFDGSALAPGIPVRPGSGYDGQFFYRLAIDPANLGSNAYGITLDAPYRLMRIGYPALTWLATAGHGAMVPFMLVAVNVAATGALGWFGAAFARMGGHHALWGLLLPAYFGLLTSVARDTAEPVACAFLLGGLLAIRTRPIRTRPIRIRHSVLPGILLAFGALTRETVMVAVACVALVRVVKVARHRTRFGREDLAWLLPVATFGLWELVVRAATGAFPLDADSDRNAGAPFIAAYDAIWGNLHQISWTRFSAVDDWLLELAMLIVVAGMALACLRRSRVPAHERIALIGYLIEICVVTPSTWNSLNADMRSFVEVYMMAVVILLGVPRARPAWSTGWQLRAAAAWAMPALYLVGMHRLVWS
ncbi:MAG TPA: hypothetical protein VF070_49465 [Streptosporangiaceae bacterium]